MPPLPPVSKVIRFDLVQSYAANAGIRDRFFLQYSGTLSQADLVTVLTTVRNAWNAQMSQQQINTVQLTQITATDLSTASSPQAINTTAATGTQAPPGVPVGVAAVLKFKIARRYRGGHPRFYVAGLPSADLSTPSVWLPALVANLPASWIAFIAACVAGPPVAVGTLIQVNVSYFAGFTNKTFPSGRIHPVPSLRAVPVVDPVTSIGLNPKVASQRRRNLQTP